MRIRQIYTSPGVADFEARIQKRYNLIPYTNPKEPAIFYGCFSAAPPTILAHKSLAIVLWAGTDVLRLLKAFAKPDWGQTKHYKEIAKRSNIHHICRSKCLQNDFDSVGLKYHFLRVSPVISEYFQNTVLGSDIYCYGAARKPEKYGGEIIERLKVDFPGIKFRDHCLQHETYLPYEKIYKIYQKCFLGLRFTQHDGLPNTVLEMGLMGRNCIFNGDLPNSLSYETYEDIKKLIIQEYNKIGKTGDEVISQKTRELLDIGEDWLDTDWYK